MRSESMRLLVMTPEKQLLLREGLSWIKAHLIDGEIGIKVNHTPLIGETIPGVVTYGNDEHQENIMLEAGILKVDESGVTIFTSGLLDPAQDEKTLEQEELTFDRLTNELLERFKIN